MVTKKVQLIALAAIILLACSCGGGDDDQTAGPQVPREQQLTELVARYPDSLLLTENLIEYYSNNGRYDSAINVTVRAIQADSQNVELWNIMGTLQFENGDTLKAIKAYETAINIYPLPEYIISLGTLYARTKNPKALAMADALTGANKTNAKKEAMFIKGLYYSYVSDKKKAILYFDSCISNDYTYMFAYREKAIALYDEEKFQDAARVLTRAVTIQNSFDEGYYWLGRVYERLDSLEKAKENYQMALLYDKNFTEAREALTRLSKK